MMKPAGCYLRPRCRRSTACAQAQALIAEHGAVTKDRWGQLRPNPACTIERDSRAAMLAALKALNLDLEPLRDKPGRPPGR